MTVPDFKYYYRAQILKVVDGDTVDAEIDIGFHTWRKERLRFYGIDAYEMNDEDETKRAKAVQGKQYVQAHTQGELIFHTYLDKLDKYGRWLVTIYYQDTVSGSWINLNRELIDKQLAVPYMARGAVI